MKELIASLKAQAEALRLEGRDELAARAMSEARRLEQTKKKLEQEGKVRDEKDSSH